MFDGHFENVLINFLQAKPLVTKKNIVELVDPLLASDYDAEQMTRVVSVVSMCIHESSTERPKMSQVLF